MIRFTNVRSGWLVRRLYLEKAPLMIPKLILPLYALAFFFGFHRGFAG